VATLVTYQIPAVCQKMFNPLTKLLYWLANSDPCWPFWCKLLQTAWFYGERLQKDGAFYFFWTTVCYVYA